MPKFSKRSLRNLNQCHPDLITLFKDVIQFVDCSIICGHRGEKEQNEAYDKGFSKLRWPKSKHNQMPSMAVDAVPYPIEWENKKRFINFGEFVLNRALYLWKDGKICHRIVWGGTWQFTDYPHFELFEPK